MDSQRLALPRWPALVLRKPSSPQSSADGAHEDFTSPGGKRHEDGYSRTFSGSPGATAPSSSMSTGTPHSGAVEFCQSSAGNCSGDAPTERTDAFTTSPVGRTT